MFVFSLEYAYAYKDLWSCLFKGVMPALHSDARMDRESFCRSFLQKYIARDVREILNVKNQRMFVKFQTI